MIVLSLLAWIPCISSFTTAGLVIGPRAISSPSSSAITMITDPGAPCPTTRREVVQRLASITSAGVITAGFAFGPAAPAVAQDTLAATKTSYFRYVPRIVEAMEWYQGDLQEAVGKEDWTKILEYFEVVNTAGPNSSRPAMYQSSSSRMQREMFKPLSVWAQSMGVKGTGPKLRALVTQEKKLEASMATLERVAEGKGVGEGQSRGKAARVAWEDGREALQEFIDVANKGMVRSLRKVETPFAKAP